MTQLISKDYLMDHVLDVECGDGTYQEAVLLEDIYDAPTLETAKIRDDCDGCKYEHRGESDEPCNICRNNYMCKYEEAEKQPDLINRADAMSIVRSAIKADIPFAIVEDLIKGLPSAKEDTDD